MENQSDLESVTGDVRTSLHKDAFAKVQRRAWDKIHLENRSPRDLVFICIDTMSSWSFLAQHLNSEEVTQAMQAPKATLIVVCTDISFYEFLSCIHLDDEQIRSIREVAPAPGKVRYLIFDDRGVDIRDIVPRNVSALH